MPSNDPSKPLPSGRRFPWAAPGDVNAFFGLMLDNIGDMILMAGLLVGVYNFPSGFVLTRMIPGTAVGVLVGDLIYTLLAFRLARREGRPDVTAMPLGLDTPSTFGAVFLILGPAFQRSIEAQHAAGQPADLDAAAHHAWFIGITMLLVSGLFKLLCATGCGWIRRHVPRAGLLGSLVAIALVIISFLPLLEIAVTPVAGFVALILIFATLFARWELPGRPATIVTCLAVGYTAFRVSNTTGQLAWVPAIAVAVGIAAALFALLARVREVPGVLLAVAIGCAIHFAMNAAGLGPPPASPPASGLQFALPFPAADWFVWIQTHGREALSYLPIALPLALATVVGGIDCTESAAAAGDEYPTGQIVAAEGVATLIGGLFGGVIQSTPYIGHPAYKAMGGRAAYTLATALSVGAIGVFGLFGWIFCILPKAVVFPILVFVGIEITQQSFRATSKKHYPAIVFACVPSLAYLASLMVDRLMSAVQATTGTEGSTFGQFSHETQQWIQTLTLLSSGFIVTSLIWGTALAWLIDGHWRGAAAILTFGGLCSFFGVMHSPLAGGPILPPWQAIAALERAGRLEASEGQTPYYWSAAYVAMAFSLVVIGCVGRRRPIEPDLLPHEREENA